MNRQVVKAARCCTMPETAQSPDFKSVEKHKVPADRAVVRAIHEQGFTLIELMIAMVIGLVLIAGLITVFVNNKKTAALTEARIEMQQAAQFALDEIARDARMSGFLGCTRSLNILADAAPTADISRSAIAGSIVEAVGTFTPDPPLGFNMPGNGIEPVVGSHVLSIQFGNQETFAINTMSSAEAPVVLQNNNSGLEKGDLAIISNCQVADLFEISDALGASLQHDASVNSGQDSLSATYGSAGITNRAQVMRFNANVYFLANAGRTNKSGDPVFSLYQQALPFDSQPMEVIEGVEMFRVRYGLRETDTDTINYVPASQLNDREDQIVSLQIGLLMQSYERVRDTDDTNSYSLTGSNISPGAAGHAGDKRLRMSFNSTINIRNRRE